MRELNEEEIELVHGGFPPFTWEVMCDDGSFVPLLGNVGCPHGGFPGSGGGGGGGGGGGW